MQRYVAGMREALRQRPPISDEDMNALAVRARDDTDARERLVVECMGLIASAAKRCRNTLGEDAFGEASVALLEAVNSYEPEQGGFRTWAVYMMWCHLANAAQKEKRFRARVLRGEEVLAAAELSPMPELLSTAARDGAITERQAQIIQMKSEGTERGAIMARFVISEKTYYRELERAMKALRQYL